jgi:hypothetical protein
MGGKPKSVPYQGFHRAVVPKVLGGTGETD